MTEPSSAALADPAPREGPLSGLVVVDLTRVLSGPYCTSMLADLGARIIKVEMPGHGDDARHIGPFVPAHDGSSPSAYFASINRGKESIALNLKQAEDRPVFEALLERADVLVENFTPGTMQRYGYDWRVLKGRYPRLILASISGFGQSGPYRELPAYDMVVQAMGGIMSLSGEEGGPPTRVGVSIGDLAAGMFAVIGIQAALLERAKTGKGRHVDIAMLDCQVALMENAFARMQVEGKVPGPIGSRHPSITPFGIFKARDGYIVLAAGNDRTFANLCSALGIADVAANTKFSSNGLRCKHHAELAQLIEQALSQQSSGQWLASLSKAGIPCGPLNDVAAVLQDPHLRARGMFLDVPVTGETTLKLASFPVKFAEGAATLSVQVPELDEHRERILLELGLSR